MAENSRWIPCSERMPAEWQIVAAYGEKIGLKCVEWHPEIGVFIDTQNEYDEQIKPEYFTKWIPLPEFAHAAGAVFFLPMCHAITSHAERSP